MTAPYKQIASWLIFSGSVVHGLWTFLMLGSVIFVLGDNDTGLAMLAFFVWGLVPLPTAFVAVRWRRLAAVIFTAVAVLTASGFVDDERYIVARNHETFNTHQSAVSLILPVAPLLFLAVFYLIAGFGKWPRIWFGAQAKASAAP
jgi:hypothetical protein